ncbi:bromodomain protein [Planoprotostelium fungivorum]|uniref:Bromodomain protein n=1 Tax=Planoprotostelium fungivorum TaxID=1890364 RepID=A0A2P6NNW5_9EUKA|nr:bromodomain protein [Planoprotostelium fungivorum]
MDYDLVKTFPVKRTEPEAFDELPVNKLLNYLTKDNIIELIGFPIFTVLGVVYGHHIRTKQFNESLFIKNDFKPKKTKEFPFNEWIVVGGTPMFSDDPGKGSRNGSDDPGKGNSGCDDPGKRSSGCDDPGKGSSGSDDPGKGILDST